MLVLNSQAIQKIELILYVRSDSHAVQVNAAVSERRFTYNYVHIVSSMNGRLGLFLPPVKRK